MTERKWYPITPIAALKAQKKAAEFIQAYGPKVGRYAGAIHGADANGVVDIEFKDLHSACAFVTFSQTNRIATILKQDADKPFASSVVVQFHMLKVTA